MFHYFKIQVYCIICMIVHLIGYRDWIYQILQVNTVTSVISACVNIDNIQLCRD